MKSWLSYSFAFVGSIGAWGVLFLAAFSVVMTGAGMGMAGFIFLALMCPVLGALLVFGLVFGQVSGRFFNAQEWLYAFSFVVVVAVFFYTLLVVGYLDEMLTDILLAVSLFFGGRYLLQRRLNA